MITEPEIRYYPAQPYVAVLARVTLPFDDEIEPILDELFKRMATAGLTATGPVFFKHNVIDMPHIEMEFGVPIEAQAEGIDGLVTGTLPAGRYGELTHFGHYDGLMDANAALIGWANDHDIRWDCQTRPDGDHFACRMEVYHNSPQEEPDIEKLETRVTIRISD